MASLACKSYRPTAATSVRAVRAPTVRVSSALQGRVHIPRYASPVRQCLWMVRANPNEPSDRSSSGPDQLPHTGTESPMGENKKATTPEQGAAPEGDKAIIGQRSQPTGAKAQGDIEKQYGSMEAYQKAQEQMKDRSAKSELQTGDNERGEGGGAGEGCSA